MRKHFSNNHLEISYQIGTNEPVVEALELIANVVVSSFADNVFKSGHHVVDEPLVYPLERQIFEFFIITPVFLTNYLIHRWLSLLGAFNVENSHKWLYCDSLKEHREVNDANGCRDKQGLQRDVLRVDEKDECKCNSASQASITHDELVDIRQLVYPKSIGNRHQENDA